MIKTSNIFDFDGTLFNTPDLNIGIKLWEKQNSKSWPYDNWYETPESLDISLNPTPNYDVINDFDKSLKNKFIKTIILTGRLKKLKNSIIHILEEYNLKPHELYLSNDGFTLPYKHNKIIELINDNPTVTEINMWEDRDFFADYYEKLGAKIGIPIFVKRIKKDNNLISSYRYVDNVYKPKSAGVIILKKINNVYNILLLKLHGDKFDLTKGRIENNESTFDTAVRECGEEANINEFNFEFGTKPIKIGNLVMYLAITNQDPIVRKNPVTNKLEHEYAIYKPIDFAEKNIKPYLRPAIEWVKTKVKT